ncbi:MAG TPA: pyridoxamine 5'-phosphate oxidase family protein [Ktedonobacteraceae bacterium]|nr:pyridoxamine 5'-phosphate oxidase family protein [Ktedonobacteraceae bacterium]
MQVTQQREGDMSGFIPWNKVDLPLRAMRSIWISTTRLDGRPHAVPVWFIWDGKNIYFITRRDMQKAKNLARQPWVIVHAGDGDDVIILEGRVQVVTDEEELNRINAAYQEKYVDPHSGARDTIFHENVDLYRVDVKHVMTWEYGTVGTRTDWWFE